MTGNNKVWRAPLAGLASIAMLATMGVAASTASAADAPAGVDAYKYTVTLHANSPKNVKDTAKVTSDGTVTGTQNVSDGVKFDGYELDYADYTADGKLDALYQKGYTVSAPSGWQFTGWYTSPEYGSEKFDFRSTTVNKNLDLYAHWAEPDQRVEFKFTAGTAVNPVLSDFSKSVYYNAPLATFAEVNVGNYELLTVAKQDSKIPAWELPGDNTGDHKVVESWSAGNGGDTTDTLSLDELTRNFNGKLNYADVGPYKVTLVPNDPDVNATTVKYFDHFGSTRLVASVDVKYGEVVPTDNLANNNWTNSYGYISQWYWRSDVSGALTAWTKGDTAKQVTGGDLYLYAGASSAAYPVRYFTEVNKHEVILGTEFVAAGESPKGIEAPSRSSDYTFVGWSKTEGYNQQTVSLSSLKINSDTDLYAQWSTNKAGVTFDYNYANKIDKQSYASGQNFVAPTPTRQGYKFLGWFYRDNWQTQTNGGTDNPFNGDNAPKNDAVFYKAFLPGSKVVGWNQSRDENTKKPTGTWLEQYTYTDTKGRIRTIRPSDVFGNTWGYKTKSIPAGARLKITADGKLQASYSTTVADPDGANGLNTVAHTELVPSTLYAAWGKVYGSDLKDQETVPGYEVNDSYEVKDTDLWTADSVAKANEALKAYGEHKVQLESNGLTDDEAATLAAELDKAQALLVQKATLPVVRLERNGQHFYSVDVKEQTVAKRNGWKVEGPAFYATDKTAPKATAVYRLYNPANGQFLLSTDANEVSVLSSQRGWQDQGVIFYAPQGGTASVQRFWKGANHNYTADANEYQYQTTKGGWTGDGQVFVASRTQVK